MKKRMVLVLVLAVAFTFSFGFCSIASAEEDVMANPDGNLLIMTSPDKFVTENLTDADQVKKELKETVMTVKSRLVKRTNGKPCIELTFGVKGNIRLDGIEVFRSLSKNKGYGKKPIYTTLNSTYNNTKVTVGKGYYYKVRGFVVLDGVKYYTDYSKKAYRIVKKNVSAKYVKPSPLYQEVKPAGGFTPAEDKTVTAELKSKFDKAFEGLDGAVYEPVELVATQVVAGINYKFLCNSKVVYPGSTVVQKYVTIYEDLQGNCSVFNIEAIEIAGGFTPAEDKTVTAELKAMFDKAFEGFAGVGYEPLELVATQVVAGINYKFLCNSKVVYPGSTVVQKYVTIYKDLQGNCSVLKIEDVE